MLVASGAFALPHLAQAAIPFFGPIIPPQSVTGVQGSDVCPAGWGMLIMVVNNIISLLITLAIVFVAPIMIAYSGFLLVINQGNSARLNEAKSILIHTIVGIVIALAAWLIVDAIMAVLTPNGQPFGQKWSDVINSGGMNPCIQVAGSLSQATLQNTVGVSTGNLNVPPSSKSGTACDPAVVQQAAAAGQPSYSLTNIQANTFACIASPESSCGANLNPPNYKWNKGTATSKGSTAAGAFQVLLSTNHTCYENTSCYAAAGVSGPLNCQNAFDSNGNPRTDAAGAALVQSCVKAADNLNCSVAAAACLLQQNNGSFSPWQQDVNSAVQSGCIANGGS